MHAALSCPAPAADIGENEVQKASALVSDTAPLVPPPSARTVPWRFYTLLRPRSPHLELRGIHFGPHRSETDSPWGAIKAQAGGPGSCIRTQSIQEAVEVFNELRWQGENVKYDDGAPQPKFFYYP